MDWDAADSSLQVDRDVGEVPWAIPGYKAGMAVLDNFCTKRLRDFHSGRNDPNLNALSNLSPWFHFGMQVQYICRGTLPQREEGVEGRGSGGEREWRGEGVEGRGRGEGVEGRGSGGEREWRGEGVEGRGRGEEREGRERGEGKMGGRGSGEREGRG